MIKTLRKLKINGNMLILLNKEKQKALYFIAKFEHFLTELVIKTKNCFHYLQVTLLEGT